MKKQTRFFCSIFMILLLILPPPVCFANDSQDIAEIPLKAPGTYSVTLVGQWTELSTKKIDTTKSYNNLEERIGDPADNEPPYSLVKTFLGWSDKAPDGNGDLAEGARLFSPSDSIGSAFPDSIPNDAKLYAVYYSVNDLEKPVTESRFLTILKNYVRKLSKELKQNSVFINLQITGEDTLPNTTNATETVNEEGRRSIIDFYSPKADQGKPHELVLEAEFRMNPKIAMLVYKNPICYDKKVPNTPERPILSRNYTDHYDKDDFSTQSEESAGYTYMDLVLTLDNGLQLPERLSLQFDAYAWRPLFVLDADRQPMSVLNPSDGKDLGKKSGAFSNLVSNTSASTRFDLNLSGANLINAEGDQEICLRVVLREGNKERISENSITPIQGKSNAETIQQNMRLKILSSDEIKTEHSSLTADEIAKRTITISDDKAKELAGTDGSSTLKVSGSLKVFLLSNTGSIYAGKRPQELKGSVTVDPATASPLQLGYKRQLGYFKETHIYNSYNQKNDLLETETVESPLQQGYSDASYSTAMQAKEGFSLSSVSGSDGAVYASNGEKKSGAFVEGATLEVTYIYEKIIEEPTTSSSTETTSHPTESEKPSDTEEIKPSEPSSTEESSPSESRPGALEETLRVERGNWETSTPEAEKDYVSIRVAETEEVRSSAQSANTEAKALPRTGEADLFLPFAALNLILGASLICYRKRKRITRH